MSELNVNNELRDYFYTQWADRSNVHWPNVVFNPEGYDEWCRFTLLNSDAQQTTIGSTTNNFRTSGLLYIQIFTRIGIGDSLALQRADEVVEIFRNWCGTNIRCRTPVVRLVGAEINWYQINVIIPFLQDELH